MSHHNANGYDLSVHLPLWSITHTGHSRIALRTRGEIERGVILDAIRSERFKAELIAAPRRILEAELETELPGDLKLHVVEESSSLRYLVIPQNPLPSQYPESDSWLEMAEWVMQGRASTLLDNDDLCVLLARAWQDPTYLTRLCLDPITILCSDFGLELTPDAEVRVEVETADSLFIVIPFLAGEWEEAFCASTFTSYVNQPMMVGQQLTLPTTSEGC
jgi:hypothetical protein